MHLNKWILLLVILIALYFLGVLAVYMFQDKFVFRPTTLHQEYNFQFEHPHQEFFVEAADGVRLNTLLFPAEGVQKGIVLYFHGNADNLQRWGQYTVDFTRRGYDVLALDYRGYGKSGGEAQEDLFYQDAYQLYQQVRQKFSPSEIILYGRSLGSAVASQLATRVRARMLVLETPFDNIPSVFQSKFPLGILPFELKNEFPNDEHVQKVQYPICIIHGTKDQLVPLKCALRLKPLLKPEDKFVVIEKGGHKNLRTFEAYQELLDRLLGIDEFKEED
ncbi:MAG: alpha/beta fold hydrolase [Bacteroidota bacterium]